MEHAKQIIDKDKVKNSSQSIYLNVSLERNFKQLIGRNSLNPTDFDKVATNKAETPKHFDLPQNVEEYLRYKKEINTETDELNSYIEKIKTQISNYQSNSSDFNKKKSALGGEKVEKKSTKINLLVFSIIFTIGLLLGAWFNK